MYRPLSRPASRPLVELFTPPPAEPPSVPAGEVLGQPLHEAFYGLREPAFAFAPDLRFLCQTAAYDRAAQAILGAVARRDRVAVLTGSEGVGKTLVCQAVADQLDRRTLTSFVSACETAEELLETVLVDFGVLSPTAGHGSSREELSAALRDFLTSLAPLQAFAVVIVDDAHELAIDVLDEIREQCERQRDERLVQFVLVGRPHLLSTLARRSQRPLADLISIRCVLRPIGRDEISRYVAHRLSAAGASHRLQFDSGALERIYQLSRGVPRMVNLLCDRALAAGFDESADVIDARSVELGAQQIDAVSRTGILSRAALVVALTALFVIGAAGAALVFRADVAAVVSAWQEVPRPPAAPVLAPSPLAPVAPPSR
jgi:general secretion pathway protein A